MSVASRGPEVRETTRRWARTPRPARPGGRLEARCPSCGRKAGAEAVRARDGQVFAGQFDFATLVLHAGCDLWALAAELDRAAVAECRVPLIHGTPAAEASP